MLCRYCIRRYTEPRSAILLKYRKLQCDVPAVKMGTVLHTEFWSGTFGHFEEQRVENFLTNWLNDGFQKTILLYGVSNICSYNKRTCLSVQVSLALPAVSHHGVTVGAWSFGNSFRLVLGCAIWNIIKVWPRQWGVLTCLSYPKCHS